MMKDTIWNLEPLPVRQLAAYPKFLKAIGLIKEFKMAVVVGKAELHGRSSNVVGNANIGAGQTMTEQIMLFEIEGQMVQLKSKSLFPIKDGDIVAAAGKLKRGTMKARAVTNVTRNMSTRSYFSMIGGKLISAILIALIVSIFIFTIPLGIMVMVIYFLDTSGAAKAAASVKSAINKYKRDQAT